MQFTLSLLALLAGSAAAQFSSSATPSSSAVPSPSATLNPEDYDCIIADRGCSWNKSEYGYDSDYCGSSPYQPFQVLDTGDIVLAVAKNGTAADGCLDQTTVACCSALQESACARAIVLATPKPTVLDAMLLTILPEPTLAPVPKGEHELIRQGTTSAGEASICGYYEGSKRKPPQHRGYDKSNDSADSRLACYDGNA
ncbi:uncharacterized protein BDV17DRAFT_294527 [Aspergillus undulatus]|uniref:uncharacterized protein n=1 Tax=Aspergillus undulatus TaxID=1810928 RepID=UPI003CCCDA90